MVLDVESLDLHAGETLVLLGPNGAGKSTLVQVMALLTSPDTGEVLHGGESARSRSLAHRRRLAVVFQDPLLLDASVESNAASGLAIRGVPNAERRTRASKWLERFGVVHLAKRSARTLSGGEAQRVSLARAFAVNPEVLFLDEPFAALDAPTRFALTEELRPLLSGGPKATVFVTHDRTEALRLGDRIAVLIDGRVRHVGTPAEVFGAPADEEVAQFVGVETIAAGRVSELRDGVAIVNVGGHAVEGGADVSPGDEVLVCLRPEDVVIGPVTEGGLTSARNHLPARVTRIVPWGPFVRVELDAGFPLVSLVTKQAVEDLALEAGTPVVVTFKAAGVHLIRRNNQTS